MWSMCLLLCLYELTGALAGLVASPVAIETAADIPHTSFRCGSQQFSGIFADVETGCQVFHFCESDGRNSSFFCPNQTLFNQKYFVCDWWHNVNCESSPSYYELNSQLYILPDHIGVLKGKITDIKPSISGSRLSNPVPAASTSITSPTASIGLGNSFGTAGGALGAGDHPHRLAPSLAAGPQIVVPEGQTYPAATPSPYIEPSLMPSYGSGGSYADPIAADPEPTPYGNAYGGGSYSGQYASSVYSDAADPEPAPYYSPYSDAADPEPAPYSIYSDAADPEPAPYSTYSDAADPEPAPYTYYSDAADPEPAPYSYYLDSADPEPAPYSLYSDAADPEPAPYSFYSGGADPEPAPAPSYYGGPVIDLSSSTDTRYRG